MAVTYDNLLSVGGFESIANLETITVNPNTTLPRGRLMGQVTATGKWVPSEGITFTTTGSTQTVAVAIGDVIYVAVASGSTGTGVLGHFYKALVVIASQDLNLEDFTVVTDYEDLGAIYGAEVPAGILYSEQVNATAAAVDVVDMVYKAGAFNSTGVTFGNSQTVATTKDDLHDVSIEIAAGVL